MCAYVGHGTHAYLDAYAPTPQHKAPTHTQPKNPTGPRAPLVGIKSALLINPATSFDRTPWPLAVPLFRNLPKQLYPWAVTPVLVGVGPDRTQFQRVLGRVFRSNNNGGKG